MSETSFSAMGTDAYAVVRSADDGVNVAAFVEAAEAVFSRFRVDSELSRINRSEQLAIRPSPVFAEVLAIADRARTVTGGLVDVGVGGHLAAWGYDRSFERVGDRFHAPDDPGGRGWSFDGATLTREPGVRLDFGGIVKGWVCDRAVESGLASVLSVGGDLRSATDACLVQVRDPWGDDAATVALGVGGLATSSVTRRTWMVGGAPAHHLIDPRTGRPAESPVISATVVGASAVDAEIGAKAVLLRGEQGLAWAADQPWIRSALVVWHDGSVYGTSAVELAS